MLDEILDLFQRGKRQRGSTRTPSAPQSGLPVGLPFLDQDDEDDEQERRKRPVRRLPDRRSRSDRSPDVGDWF